MSNAVRISLCTARKGRAQDMQEASLFVCLAWYSATLERKRLENFC